jgi:hypothetical protein
MEQAPLEFRHADLDSRARPNSSCAVRLAIDHFRLLDGLSGGIDASFDFHVGF